MPLSMERARHPAVAAWTAATLMIFGASGPHNKAPLVDAYNSELQQWTPKPSTPSNHFKYAGVELDGSLLFFGDGLMPLTFQEDNFVATYEIQAAKWSQGALMPLHAAATIGWSPSVPNSAFLLPCCDDILENAGNPLDSQTGIAAAHIIADPCVIQDIDHLEDPTPVDLVSDAKVADIIWAQKIELDLIAGARPHHVEPILVMKFKGNADLLLERLGQVRIQDLRCMQTLTPQVDHSLSVLESRMVSADGLETVKKLRETLQQAVVELEHKTSDIQHELAKVVETQHFKDLSSQPAFAGGASVFVTPNAASELEAAIKECELTLGKQHVLVSESYLPLVTAAIEVEKLSGDRRREPKEDLKNRTELDRGVFSPEVSDAWRHEHEILEVGRLHREDHSVSTDRHTHSTGSIPNGSTWSFGASRKSFHLKSHRPAE